MITQQTSLHTEPMPTVSFIMTIYKRRFLKQAIDSVLAQTCRDFELVMVDDKSPENLYEVIEEYPWEKKYEILPDGGRKWIVDGISVRYYRNAEDIGEKDLVAAWNHAIQYATGVWCVLASDDDIYMPRFLEELLSLSKKYPKCDLIHCRIAGIDEEGHWKWLGMPRAEFETGLEMAYHCFIRRIEQRIGDLMIRLSVIRSNGGYVWLPKAWGADYWSSVFFAKDNGAACTPEVLFLWRQSSINISMATNDAAAKITANEMKRALMTKYVHSMKARGPYEEFLLHALENEYDHVVDSQTRWSLDRTGFISFLKVLLTVKFSRPSKWRLLLARLKRNMRFWH